MSRITTRLAPRSAATRAPAGTRGRAPAHARPSRVPHAAPQGRGSAQRPAGVTAPRGGQAAWVFSPPGAQGRGDAERGARRRAAAAPLGSQAAWRDAEPEGTVISQGLCHSQRGLRLRGGDAGLSLTPLLPLWCWFHNLTLSAPSLAGWSYAAQRARGRHGRAAAGVQGHCDTPLGSGGFGCLQPLLLGADGLPVRLRPHKGKLGRLLGVPSSLCSEQRSPRPPHAHPNGAELAPNPVVLSWDLPVPPAPPAEPHAGGWVPAPQHPAAAPNHPKSSWGAHHTHSRTWGHILV